MYNISCTQQVQVGACIQIKATGTPFTIHPTSKQTHTHNVRKTIKTAPPQNRNATTTLQEQQQPKTLHTVEERNKQSQDCFQKKQSKTTLPVTAMLLCFYDIISQKHEKTFPTWVHFAFISETRSINIQQRTATRKKRGGGGWGSGAQRSLSTQLRSHNNSSVLV